MSKHHEVSITELRAVATLIDFEVSDEQLARLLPLVQALWDGMASLDELDLEGISPEPIFRAAFSVTNDCKR